MRRSTKVTAPILAATALAFLTGCKHKELQRCVDEHNQVVPDSYCANAPQAAQGAQAQQQQHRDSNGILVPLLLYHYYYGGYGQNIGDRVGGGGYVPMPGHSYGIAPSTRGGFGSSFHSSGAHGSGAAE